MPKLRQRGCSALEEQTPSLHYVRSAIVRRKRHSMKKFFRFIVSRPFFTGLFILLQLCALLLVIVVLNEYFLLFYAGSLMLGVLLVIYIVSRNGNPAYKIAWIIPILALPIFGTLLFLVFGRDTLTKREKERMDFVTEKYKSAMAASETRFPSSLPADVVCMQRYIRNTAFAPAYSGTETRYLPLGEIMHEEMLKALESAEHFIFLEYYIISPGIMWDSIHEILRRKAAAGVDVRLIYDDWGCMFRLPDDYDQKLEEEGIRCCVFSRFRPELSSRFNNRNHRKICVVDGNIGFTGGINISDEYINASPRCGHWLDCGIMLRGRGVYGLTAMFLSMWDVIRREDDDFSHFAPDEMFCRNAHASGWVQPFMDSPLDSHAVGENVYLQIINRATRYVYINSPYLIVDNEILTALCSAAQSGVDVRIVTPAICDSRIVHEITRSYYEPLIQAGVKLYEYTPGMVHAKTFVSDDRVAVVGSINLDYRSLYLHYECAVWMFETAAIAEMKSAYLDEVGRSTFITEDTCRMQRRGKRLLRAVLRTLAPLF